MSLAGVYSNRGDEYERLIAIKWALNVLSSPDYIWLEVNSINDLVDDVVIGKPDGSRICCQCKKNETDFKNWTLNTLADELVKAAIHLSENQEDLVRFYSRNNFGLIAKQREFAEINSSETEYRTNLTGKKQETDNTLAEIIKSGRSNISTYDFLNRISFHVTDDYDQLALELTERLALLSTNAESAFSALHQTISGHSGRAQTNLSTAYGLPRLTKEDLRYSLNSSGAMLSPSISKAEIQKSFSEISAIGRSWEREVNGRKISTPVVTQILEAIKLKKRSILLTGTPGSGKTCVLLELQERLEDLAKSQGSLIPLFIQSREFADHATPAERHTKGLDSQWVERAGRGAEYAHVVVCIDSLDVLSIAREHSTLEYFLAQIDRLLSIPNVTVVTSCREFDRRFDQSIASRKWDFEVSCIPLDWKSSITPLLESLGIDPTTVCESTRAVIQTPRELSLFTELALHATNIKVVTSHALTQRYLEKIVRDDHALGDDAMKAVESIATEMLVTRRLSVPLLSINIKPDVRQRLISLNILRPTQDRNLTFGHQTLMDVLVINNAIRRGDSLSSFINGLQPVPFVRPSIRSFVSQLASGDPKAYRAQIRTVLTGNSAFHIRRLVAKSFSEQPPCRQDWPLVRELRTSHPEIYQLIYSNATHIEWHDFWLSHLVPILIETQNGRELSAHVHRLKQWANQKPKEVVELWTDALNFEWADSSYLAGRLCYHVSSLEDQHLIHAVPLLEKLAGMPLPAHTYLGRTIARCVANNVTDDHLLWKFIIGNISQEDFSTHNLGDKLRCDRNEFGHSDDNFLQERMSKSTVLLELAVETIEQWHTTGTSIGGYYSPFVLHTSFDAIHSSTDSSYISAVTILTNAIESAVVSHAARNSRWWTTNRHRLCNSDEEALKYIAIAGLEASIPNNLDIIKDLVVDPTLFKSEFSYELGSLISSAYIYLDNATQDKVLETILSFRQEDSELISCPDWALRERHDHLSAIPCHLRSPEAQIAVEGYEQVHGKFYRRPHISHTSGFVRAPFKYEVFLNASDSSVLMLLDHYSGYDSGFDETLTGGEREVGMQLAEAASRKPSRFLQLLRTSGPAISENFRHCILEGVSDYILRGQGNNQPDAAWIPVEKTATTVVAAETLSELTHRPEYWQKTRSAAKALKACADAVDNLSLAKQLIQLATDYEDLQEEPPIKGDSVGLLDVGINMASGKAAEALMMLSRSLLEQGIDMPIELARSLHQFAQHQSLAVRTVILYLLPNLERKEPDLSWSLLNAVVESEHTLWREAERFLYNEYHHNFPKVSPLLQRIRNGGHEKSLKTWGRLSALAGLSSHIDLSDFLSELVSLDSRSAWQGAASVWSHPNNIRSHRDMCIAGIKFGLESKHSHVPSIAHCFSRAFADKNPVVLISVDMIRLFFHSLPTAEGSESPRLHNFTYWLNEAERQDPQLALAAAEFYLTHINGYDYDFYDHNDLFSQLLTKLFAEAEEIEESDNGAMLLRVIRLQDGLLSLGMDSIEEWLSAAERP